MGLEEEGEEGAAALVFVLYLDGFDTQYRKIKNKSRLFFVYFLLDMFLLYD